MYPVSLDYLEAIKSTHRIFALKLEIDTAFETFSLTDKDVDMGSLKLEEGCATGSTLTLGEAKAASFSISIGNRDGRYDDTQFNGGIMRPVLGLELPGGSLEWVPLGIFNIDDVSRPTTSVSLEGADNLILFDVAFSDVPVSFPTTNKQLLAAICNHVGVSLATSAFLNDDYVVQKAPGGTPSCRDIVKCIAELAAGYAQCDRTTGALKIVQFQNPGCVQEANLDGGDFLGTDHTAKGNSVTFGAPFGTIVKSLAGTGNTTLDGSGNASPGNIRTIHGVEYIEKWEGMSAENRNLCAPNYFKSQEWYGYIMSGGTIYPNDTLDLHSDYIHINPEYGEMQFTIFEFATHGNPVVGFYQSDKTFISRTSLPSTGTAPLVTPISIPSNAAYIRFCIANPTYYGGKHKVEFGTVATDYSVAPEDLPSYQKVMLPQPLYNLPDGTADNYEAIGATGTQKVACPILKGTENFWLYWNNRRDIQIAHGMATFVLGDYSLSCSTAVCSHFVQDQSIGGGTGGSTPLGAFGIFYTAPNKRIFICIDISIIGATSTSTDAEFISCFKSWLAAQYAAGTPVAFLYELATPVAITGTPQSITASADTTVTADNGGQAEVTYNTPDGDNADGGDFKWYNTKKLDGGAFIVPDPAVSLGPANRYDFKIDDNPVTVTGIVYEAQDKDYVIGDRSYALHITDNALIQGDPTDVLERIADAMIGFTYLPFTSSWQGNPALQPGDIIQQTDRNGVSYRTIVTNSTYIYRGVCDLSAKGASEIAHGFQSQQTKRATQLLRLIHEKEVKISSLDQAILNATSLIAGALGSHWIDGDKLPDEKYHGNVFIADNADITKAKKVWRWNLGGFGHSNNGVDGPYTAAITADDSIVANLVTASMIKTGRLESLTNPNVYFDLDEGVLCASRLVSSEDGATDVYADVGLQSWEDGSKTKGIRLASKDGNFLMLTQSSSNNGNPSAIINSPGDLCIAAKTESPSGAYFLSPNSVTISTDSNGNTRFRLNLDNGGASIEIYKNIGGQNEITIYLGNRLFNINEDGWDGDVRGVNGIDYNTTINGITYHYRHGMLASTT